MWEKRIQVLLGLLVLVLVAFLVSGTVAFRTFGTAAEAEKKQKKVDSDATTRPIRENVVVLDAGHGGVDPGKIGVNDALEKDINLQIVYWLRECLEAQGIQVVLTREEEDGLYSEQSANKKTEDMQKRCQIIREVNPKIAVSIHQNSYPAERVQGAQVFYYTKSEEGRRLAEEIQNVLIQELDADNRREAKGNADYYILRHTAVPTVIVECGFLSNWEEAERLVTKEYQQQVAQAICKGIVRYLDKEFVETFF